MRRTIGLILSIAPLAFLACWIAPSGSPPDAGAAPAPPRLHASRRPDLARIWPMYGGDPSRNMANPFARGIVGDFSVQRGREKNVRWSVRLGTNGYSVPAVVGSRLFIGANNEWPRDPKVKGDRGVMLCLCTHSGKMLWQITHDKLPKPDANDAHRQGIASSPCVEGDRVYYVSNRAEVVCADVHGDGKGGGRILWSFDMIKELGVFPCQLATCSPLVLGDAVFVVTGNGVDITTNKLPAPNAPAFLALNRRTGKVLWHSNLPGRNVMRGQWGNPAAAVVAGKAQVLFPGGDGWLYAFEPGTGELLWKFDCNPKAATPYRSGGGGEKAFSLLIAPVVHEDRVYIAIGQEPDDGYGVGHLWCIDPSKKPTNREKDLSPVGDNFDPRAAVNRNSGLVWHYGGKLPNPIPDGREFVFGRTLATMAIHDGLLYAVELNGYLHCVDARTGKVYWVYDFQESTWNSAYYADGKVFVGTDSGDLYVFRHGRKMAPPRKFNLRQPIKAPPVAAGGVLYLNTGTHLYALAKP